MRLFRVHFKCNRFVPIHDDSCLVLHEYHWIEMLTARGGEDKDEDDTAPK